MALTMPSPRAASPRWQGGPSWRPEVHREAGCTVVALHGDVDTTVRRALSRVLASVIASGTDDVVVDLSDATFIAIGALRTLATGRHLLGQQGRELTFRSPSRLATHVLRMFESTGSIERQESTGR